MLIIIGGRIDEHEILSRETEYIRKSQTEVTELKNTIPELIYILERLNSRLVEDTDWISKLENKTIEFTQTAK